MAMPVHVTIGSGQPASAPRPPRNELSEYAAGAVKTAWKTVGVRPCTKMFLGALLLADVTYLVMSRSMSDVVWYPIALLLAVFIWCGAIAGYRGSREYVAERRNRRPDDTTPVPPTDDDSEPVGPGNENVIEPDKLPIEAHRSRLVLELRKLITYVRSHWPDFVLRVETEVDPEASVSRLRTLVDKARRLVTGNTLDPMHDRLRWFKKPSNDFPHYDSFDSWWIGMPGLYRLLLRSTFVLYVLVATKTLTVESRVMHTVGVILVALMTTCIVLGSVRLCWKLTGARHTRRVIEDPITYGGYDIVPLRGQRPVTVHKHAGRQGVSSIQIDLTVTEHLTEAKKKELANLVRQRVPGGGSLNPAFMMTGLKPYVTFTMPPQPPERVLWADIEHLARASWENRRVLLGLGGGEWNPVYWDLTKAPHALFSADSGSGKSVSVTGFMLQALYGGGQVLMLDTKEISHRWARDIPGIEYFDSVRSVHDALRVLAHGQYGANDGILNQRIELLKGAPYDVEDEDADVGPRMLIVVEELNDTVQMLRRHWRDDGNRGESPAVQALHTIGAKGRALKMHLVVLAQSASAAAFGGRDARENYRARLISAGATAKTWNMLTDIRPRPPRSTVPGRYHFVLAGTAREVQAPYITLKEARPLAYEAMGNARWARSERGVWTPDDGSSVQDAEVVTGCDTVTALGNTSPDQPKQVSQSHPVTPLPPPSQSVTLAEFVAQYPQFGGRSAFATRKARDPGFPKEGTKRSRSNALTYDLEELKAYYGVTTDE